MIKDLFEDLDRTLISSYQDDCKRTSKIEKIQIEIINQSISDLANEYSGEVLFDCDNFNTGKKGNRWYIDNEGKIEEQGKGYNEWHDCKRFDGIINVTSHGITHTIFLILKGVEYQGGHQRNVKQEIGKYCDCIKKNNDKKYHFVFVLDGKYINERLSELKISERSYVCNSKKFKKTIKTFILKNFNLY